MILERIADSNLRRIVAECFTSAGRKVTKPTPAKIVSHVEGQIRRRIHVALNSQEADAYNTALKTLQCYQAEAEGYAAQMIAALPKQPAGRARR